jgi:4-hydroxybenzoate polyprenyltransferase
VVARRSAPAAVTGATAAAVTNRESMSSVSLSSTAIWGNARALLKTMRPQQWVKNLIIYAALVFDGKLFEPGPFLYTTLLVICFCFASSSVYLMNDLVDIEKDQQHPVKRFRPLPNGQLNPLLASIVAGILAASSLAITFWLNPWVGIVTGAYLLQNIAYSFYLKNIVIVDVMILALGFLLRVIAGVLVV